jgi:hypothetical protein
METFRMALTIGELQEALRIAGVPDDNARAAAEAVEDFERRIGRTPTLTPVNGAVLAIDTAPVIAAAGRLFQLF